MWIRKQRQRVLAIQKGQAKVLRAAAVPAAAPAVLQETAASKRRRTTLAYASTVDVILPHIISPTKEVPEHFAQMYPCYRYKDERFKNNRCLQIAQQLFQMRSSVTVRSLLVVSDVC